MSELEISVRKAKEDNDISVVTLNGSVDGYTLVKFDEAVYELLNANQTKIIIDCKGLNFISSAGMGILIVAHSKLLLQNGDIKLINMDSEVYHTFELLGFSNVFRILNNEREALEEFKGG